MKKLWLVALSSIAATIPRLMPGQTSGRAEVPSEAAEEKGLVRGILDPAICQYRDIVADYPTQAPTGDPFSAQAPDYLKNLTGFIPTPDGNHIIYSERGSGSKGRTQLLLRELTTGHEHIFAQLEPGDVVGGFRCSPDGKHIVFNKFPEKTVATGALYSDIYLVTVATGASRILPGTAGANEISWSPDGQRLALEVLFDTSAHGRAKGDLFGACC